MYIMLVDGAFVNIVHVCTCEKTSSPWQIFLHIRKLPIFSKTICRKYGNGSQVRIGWVQNDVLYVTCRSSSNIKQQSDAKVLVPKNLSYSNAKCTLRVLLIPLTVEKIKHEKFNFVFLSFFYFSFVHNSQTVQCIQMICTSNDCSTIRDFPFTG